MDSEARDADGDELSFVSKTSVSSHQDRVGDAGGYGSTIYRWYVLSILMIAYAVSFVDRQIVGLLVQPIKMDLGLSDTQISLLHGFAFAIFYSILGIPLGRMVDRANRTRLIALSAFIWGLATACGGLARDFWQFFIARVAVGIGEAAVSPASYSIISDTFPPQSRGGPMGVYASGVFLGAGLAMVFAGAIIHWASTAAGFQLPLLGVLRPWQLTLVIVSLPCLPIVLLMLIVREPPRLEKLANVRTQQPWSAVFRFAWARRSSVGAIVLGASFLSMSTFSVLAWTAALIVRRFGWSPGDVGYAFGLTVAVAGTLGVVVGGVASDRLERRFGAGAQVRVAAFACLMTLILAPGLAVADHALAVFAVVAGLLFVLALAVACVPPALTSLTANDLRGQVIAMYLLGTNIVGLGGGPTLVALLTDRVMGDEALVHYSLAIVCPLSAVLGGLLFLRAIVSLRSDAVPSVGTAVYQE